MILFKRHAVDADGTNAKRILVTHWAYILSDTAGVLKAIALVSYQLSHDQPLLLRIFSRKLHTLYGFYSRVCLILSFVGSEIIDLSLLEYFRRFVLKNLYTRSDLVTHMVLVVYSLFCSCLTKSHEVIQ